MCFVEILMKNDLTVLQTQALQRAQQNTIWASLHIRSTCKYYHNLKFVLKYQS
jgi:hypothetical protein